MIKTEKYGILTLLIIAALVSFGVNFFSPTGIALKGQWDSDKGVVTAKSKQDSVHSQIELHDPHKVRQILVYCSGVECTDSHTFATQLTAMRFMKVQVFAGGFS